MEKRILHIDVNNAFLSWSAVDRLKHGDKLDLRTIPAIIGGDESKRRGIVVAKSNIAKQFGIKTGEPIYIARKKCPSIITIPANHALYKKYSDNLYKLFCEYTDKIERFSIDECFLDLTEFIKPGEDVLKIAIEIKERVKRELGFTVNIGISDDKILAKMASDFEKPDKIHTLFKNEIEYKMWNLPISELFMVGKKSLGKLDKLGIKTIGDLAKKDERFMIKHFGKYGFMIWSYANGNSNEEVNYKESRPKGIGNSITLPYDMVSLEDLNPVLVRLSEQVSYRLRKENMVASVVNVQLKNNKFEVYSHQKKLSNRTDSSKEITKAAKELLEELYKGDKIRLIGIRVDGLSEKDEIQLSLFDVSEESKDKKIDKTIDLLKEKFGYSMIKKASEIKIEDKQIKQ